MNLKPGDKCIVLPHAMCMEDPAFGASMRGKVVTLIRYIGKPLFGGLSQYGDFWEVDARYNGMPVNIDESALEKLPPPKREPLGDWAQCPWQPKEVIAKTREKELVTVDCGDYMAYNVRN